MGSALCLLSIWGFAPLTCMSFPSPISEFTLNSCSFYAQDNSEDALHDRQCDSIAMSLPTRCAAGIPTLKFFMLSHTFKSGSDGWEDADMEATDRQLTYHEREMKKKRFWRIAREGTECGVQRLAVPQFLRFIQCLEAGFDGKDPVEGKYSCCMLQL